MVEDYYKVLGLKRGATLKEISAAYRAQALIHHPDKRKSSTADAESDEKFHKIKAAHQALLDPKIRAELDLQLVGLEERIKRDAQMSSQRKKMRDDLLNREKEASNAKKREFPNEPHEEQKKRTPKSDFEQQISNQEACLLLKCKFSDNIDRKLALEMIRSSFDHLVSLHQDSNSTNSTVAVEFRTPQDAYKALCRLPNDLITKADWFLGYAPDGLNIELGPLTPTPTAALRSESKPAAKYSKEMEESILERLKRKKMEKQDK